jgi:predicted dehydrogenase
VAQGEEHSGGLLVHKASHHFDLVNWWIRSAPRRVYASGGLRFYGADNAAARGIGNRPARGTHDGADAFELDLRDDERLKALYLDAEQHDGYLRDRDVFGEGITIEDNLALVVDYASGATLSYSLNAHAPWEGYRVAVNGTLGRAELEVVERGAVLADEGLHPVLDPSAARAGASGSLRPEGERLIVQRHWEAAYEVPLEGNGDGHGGGDALLLADVFEGPGDDPLARPADWRDGVRSIAVGIAGNRSLETGLPVQVAELGIRLLTTPAAEAAPVRA